MNKGTIRFSDYQIYVRNSHALTEEIHTAIAKKQQMTVLSMNTLKLHLGEKDAKAKKLFKQFTHIIPDGQSVVFALRILYRLKISAISGAEFMIHLLKEADRQNYSVFFLGSPQSLLDKVKNTIAGDFPGIHKVGYQHGYYDQNDEQSVVQKIADFQPDLLFVAFGSPRKEMFIQQYKDTLKGTILMGVGGSYEVLVGEKKLDSVTKKLGLRWLVRTLQDPVRLFPRYAVCNTYFLYLLMSSMVHKVTK